MGLESATYITDLDASWPLGTDQRSTADDHTRLVKAVLQNTFPAANGAVTASAGRMNTVFVQGLIANGANVMSGGSLDMANTVLDNAQLQSYEEVFISKGVVNAAASATLDYADGNNFGMTIGTNTLTVSFANWPTSGVKGTVNLEVTQDGTGSRGLKFPTAVKWTGGVQPPASQSAGTVSSYSFTSRDNGTTIFGYQTGFDQQ